MNLLCRITNVLKTPDNPRRDPAQLAGMGAVFVPLLVVGILGLSAPWNAAVAQQREVAALRQEVQSRNAGDRSVSESRGGDEFALPARWQNTKEGRVFQAYDKNGDQIVSLDEWLGMTNGNISPARRELQTKRFNEAEPSGDGNFTPAEFIYWYGTGRFEGVQRGARVGEGDKTVPRDGDRE